MGNEGGLVRCVWWRVLLLLWVAAYVMAGTGGEESSIAPAAAPVPAAFLRGLESSYNGVRTLRAEFTQTYTWGGRRRVESGTVYLVRGGAMRWEYRVPREKLFVSDGKQLLLYLPEEKQVTRSSVKTSEDLRVPFGLLLTRLNLGKIFSRVEFVKEGGESAEGTHTLRGLPKGGQEQDYREVLFEVTKNWDIRRLTVAFLDHSTMEYVFHRIERNVVVNPSWFRFTPPPGTQVINRR